VGSGGRRWYPAAGVGGGGGRRRDPVVGAHRREVREERGDHLGQMRVRGLRPLRAWGAGVGRGRGIRPSPALPSCEPRIELLNRAGLGGIIRVNWAVPISAGPVYQTAKLLEFSVGQGIARLGRPTKHALIVLSCCIHYILLFCNTHLVAFYLPAVWIWLFFCELCIWPFGFRMVMMLPKLLIMFH
jgi:hypothetical protein